jgi:hypothetical protein
MSKPKKTILQLETLIKKEAAKSMLLPKDIVVFNLARYRWLESRMPQPAPIAR